MSKQQYFVDFSVVFNFFLFLWRKLSYSWIETQTGGRKLHTVEKIMAISHLIVILLPVEIPVSGEDNHFDNNKDLYFTYTITLWRMLLHIIAIEHIQSNKICMQIMRVSWWLLHNNSVFTFHHVQNSLISIMYCRTKLQFW